MNILDLSTIKKSELLSGVLVYFQSYEVKSFDKGKGPQKYVTGDLAYKSAVRQFTIWDATLVNAFSEMDMTGQVATISGATSEFKGAIQIKIESVDFQSAANVSRSLFIRSVDVEAVFNELGAFLTANMPQDTLALSNLILKTENLFEPLKLAWAGSKLHDAQIGGLINHIVKMLKISKTLFDNDANLNQYRDVVTFGILMHDIGKIQEIVNGKYTQYSYVTHLVFGLELMIKYKETIIQVKGEKFYYDVLSVIQGHHGDFDSPAKTVAAKLVHLIDMLDSQATIISDAITGGSVTDYHGHKVIKIFSETLAV